MKAVLITVIAGAFLYNLVSEIVAKPMLAVWLAAVIVGLPTVVFGVDALLARRATRAERPSEPSQSHPRVG